MGAYLDDVLLTVPDAALEVDAEGLVRGANEAACELLGYSHEELVRSPLAALLPDGLRARHESLVRAAFERPRGREMGAPLNVVARRKDGTELAVDVSLGFVDTPGGRRALATIRDLSVHRAAVRAAEARAERLDSLLRLARMGSWELDPRSGEQSLSTELAAHLSDSTDGPPPRSFMEALVPEERRRLEAAIAATQREGAWWSGTLRAGARGPARWFETTIFVERDAQGLPIRVRGFASDVSERVRAADDALALERRFREVVEHASDAIVVVDEDGTVEYFNAAAEALFGRGRAEVVAGPLAAIVPQLDGARHAPGFASAARSGRTGPIGSWRVQGLRPDDAPFAAECTVTAHRVDGRTRFTAFLRDTRAREEAESALRRSEARFRQLIERSPDAISVHRGGRFVYVNPATLRYLGYDSAEELLGRPVLDVVHADERAQVAPRLRSQSSEALPAREERFVRRDGGVVWAEVIALPIEFDGEDATVVVARDTTERRELASRLLQLDRVLAVGTLAAGVGHEINNPLQFVVSNLEYMARALPDLIAQAESTESCPACFASAGLAERQALVLELGDVVTLLAETREGVERIGRVVRDLGGLARPAEPRAKPVALERAVESAVHLAWSTIRPVAHFVRDYGAAPVVLAEEGRLVQVVLNLLVNASQAIPPGDPDAHEIRVRTFVDGDVACLDVSDTGAGIAGGDLARVFDPFFTTKPAGVGTGLGLAIVRSLVRGMGGDVRIVSARKGGTCFRVSLPVAPPGAADERPAPEQARGDQGLGGRVLVIDDDPSVAAALTRTLLPICECRTSTSAREGLSRLAAGEDFAVILCDVWMPDISGPQFLAIVAERFPAYARRVVFLSGDATALGGRLPGSASANRLLAKPFDPDELRALVRRLLSEPTPV